MLRAKVLPRRAQRDVDRLPVRASDPGVARIVERIRTGGDAALAHVAHELGDAPPREFERSEIAAARDRIPAELEGALVRAHDRIERFAEAQLRALQAFSYSAEGVTVGQRLVPLARAGAYIPGGAHPLPSTALMTIVPARVAGVRSIIACTPRATDATLAACAIAKADRVFEIGGAQAIAAMAYGTASVPAVDKIVGPGNAYVTEAKRLVAGHCGIDMLAGPSEVGIIASHDADPAEVARALLAEAEHDVDARAFLICDSEQMLERVESALEDALENLETASVIRAALAKSAAIVCGSLDECVRAADELAVEHLELHGSQARALAERVREYGALFVGVPAAVGDYGAGPNHTLPTNRAARFRGGLSVYDFVVARTFVALDPQVRTGPSLIDDGVTLAACEGLPAHRLALEALR